MMKPRILHVITGLDRGGAETTLLRLLGHPATAGFRHDVLSLMSGGTLRTAVESVAGTVLDLGMRRGAPGPIAAWRLGVAARRLAPDLYVGWMYHGNLAASFAAFFHRAPVVWNIRHSPDALHDEKRLTAWLIRIGRRWATSTAGIVFNSRRSARQHEALGYPEDRSRVIANGVDCARFQPSPEARTAIRRELGVPEDAVVVGRFGRYHPVKDHRGLLAAARRVGRDVHWLFVGGGLEPVPEELRPAVRQGGLSERCHFVGERDDLPRWMAAVDLFCSNSRTEAFPNVVAEAMACGVAGVVTDAGESANVVGETGRIVPPGDPERLAEAISRMVELSPDERTRLGSMARRRIMEGFTADASFRHHCRIWSEALGGAAEMRR